MSHVTRTTESWLTFWKPPSKREPWLICTCDMTQSHDGCLLQNMSHDSSVGVPWLAVTYIFRKHQWYVKCLHILICLLQYVCHDVFTRVTWLIWKYVCRFLPMCRGYTYRCLFQLMHYSASTRVTWLMYMCIYRSVMCAVVPHVTISLSLYLPWGISMCDVTHAYVYPQISGYVCCLCCLCVVTRWRRRVGCLIFVGRLPQKSPIISDSCAERDLQLKASSASSPLCTWVYHSFLITAMTHLHVWRDSCIRVSTHPWICAVVARFKVSIFLYAPWLIHMCDVTREYVFLFLQIPWYV